LLTAYLVLSLGGVAAGIVGGARQFGGFRTSNKAADVAKDIADQIAVLSLSGLLAAAASAVFLMFVRQLSARHIALTGET
jgi:hypothetical protein